MKAVASTATLADAVARAARVAPSKGAGFDKACGVLIEGWPFSGKLVIRSTDLSSTYRQEVAADVDGEATWRLPSALLAGILTGLPMSPGGQVTLTDEGLTAEVKIQAGTAKSRLRLIMGDFPAWDAFDAEPLVHVSDFGQRVEQVAWATDPKGTVLSGVHINGEKLIACDMYKVCVVPLVVPVETPITAPLLTLAALLKNAGDVSLQATEKKLRLLLDPETQATTELILAEYPNVERVMRDTFSGQVTVSREDLQSAIDRMLVLVAGDRYPRLRVGFGDGVVMLKMEDEQAGVMQNEVDCKGGQADTFIIELTPRSFIGALAHANHPEVTVKYGPKDDQTISVQAPDYRCDLMPRMKGGSGT